MGFKFEGRGLAVDQPAKIIVLDERTTRPIKSVVGDKEFEAFIEGYSTDSRRAQAFRKAQEDKRSRNGIRVMNAEERETLRVEMLAHLTQAWCIITPDGDIIDEPYSEAAGLAFFASPEWISYRDQYEAGLATRANFIRKPSSA